jgi:hypothetical protein
LRTWGRSVRGSKARRMVAMPSGDVRVCGEYE